jgi:hypothetical protein
MLIERDFLGLEPGCSFLDLQYVLCCTPIGKKSQAGARLPWPGAPVSGQPGF